MALSAGDKLGPYEIVELIGKGGMGEVFRARDTRLGRDVAIKVSAEQFSDRFKREARAVAALNHPNICILYDVGSNYLVMEMVEGETLAERIKQGAIPLEEALGIARQVTDALEAAHEKGITHRDLKPGNIKITPEGKVKVLDFGLAKVAEASSSPGSDPGQSPTMTLEAATRAGVILGTADYMAPEQARGKPVDKRADIWAFGVVLYEMVTGKELFRGEDLTETLASVVKEQPDLSEAPPGVRRLLADCLEKDPKKRLRDIGDVWRLLEEPLAPPAIAARSRFGWLPWAVAGTATLVAAVALFLWLRAPTPETLTTQFQIETPQGTQVYAPAASTAVSPDGRYIVMGAGQRDPLWLRPLNSLTARSLEGTEGADFPFWSPDGKSVAFFADGKLKRIDIDGGAPLTLCDAGGRGGSWSRNGSILFAVRNGLFLVPTGGGQPHPVTDIGRGEVFHVFPQFLPDGKHFLYFIYSSDPSVRGIYVASLDNPKQRVRVMFADGRASYVPPLGKQPGYLLWLRGQTLLAQPFDAGTLALSGGPGPIAEDVIAGNRRYGAFWTSDVGLLAYRTGSGLSLRSLTWLDRQGKVTGTAGPDQNYDELSLSPDGSQIAAFRRDSVGENLWLVDVVRGSTTRLTTGSTNQSYPVWSPDGTQVVFSESGSEHSHNLYRKPASPSAEAELLWKDESEKRPLDWSRDGRFLLYESEGPDSGRDLYVLSMTGTEHKPTAYLKTPFNEDQAKFSPDSRWVSYLSNISGTPEIYVSPFPDAGSGPAVIVSTGGGSQARWRRDGKALYYLSPDRKLMEVELTFGSTLKAGVPRALFDAPNMDPIESRAAWRWDVTPDGRRFLFNVRKGDADVSRPLTIVTNWQEMLKK